MDKREMHTFTWRCLTCGGEMAEPGFGLNGVIACKSCREKINGQLVAKEHRWDRGTGDDKSGLATLLPEKP